MDYLKQ